ncbi:MAG: peptidoglycan editing factor PgeF [Granulosicoccus sp.]|nr:peptidoglycan editing factor PgeF [Granulosicoccus sp.]
MSNQSTDVVTGNEPQFIKASWDAPDHVLAGTTTRIGGRSTGTYAGLNLGLHVNDEQAIVLKNRALVHEALEFPSEPVWLRQSHGTTILRVDDTVAQGDADGAYTCTVDTVLAVLTADCLPLVLTNRNASELAVVHAGWRGLAGGIVHSAMACFDLREGLQAWMGPAIGKEMFEVGEDVLTAFTDREPTYKQYFEPRATPGKYLCDLYALARAELRASGCGSVSGGEYCTYKHGKTFYSYRRDGAGSGRMATFAWLSNRI